MKHITKAIALSYLGIAGITSTVSSNAAADTVLGGYVGVQGWQMNTEGAFAQNASLSAFSFEKEANTSFYAALEHPIPLVPNIKVARTTLNTSGTTFIDSQFNFGDQVFLAGTTTNQQVELVATDYILYYEMFDNDLLSFDIGVSGKELAGDIFVTDTSGRSAQQNIDVIIPMGYAKLQVGLPFTGLSVLAEGSLLAIDDDSFSDYIIALSYSFVETLALDLSIQAGYRSTEIDLNDIDDIYANMQFDGAFIGIEFDF